MRILMSGQIYIKREPAIVEIDPGTMGYRFEVDEDGSISLNPEVDDDLFSGEYKDYRGCTSFWISAVNENGIDMIETMPLGNTTMINFICDDGNLEVNESHTSLQFGNRIHFTSVDEMEDEFMPLTEFLAKSKYIGRKFKLNVIHPIFDSLNRGNDRTVLYATDNIILIENYNDRFGHLFEIMRSDSKEDIDCSLHEVNTTLDESYKNKALVYKKIFDYLSKNKRKEL